MEISRKNANGITQDESPYAALQSHSHELPAIASFLKPPTLLTSESLKQEHLEESAEILNLQC